MKWLLCASVSAITAATLLAGPEAAQNPVVAIDTSLGTIKVGLYADKAPNTVRNFLTYVDDKFYDGTLFHRVIPEFMVQGGGFLPGMNEKPGAKAPIQNESANGLSNGRGTIAMARTPDPNSATCQFFINLVDNTRLDRGQTADGAGYCVFGKVIDGMDVVDKIAKVATSSHGAHANVPEQDVVIKAVRREGR